MTACGTCNSHEHKFLHSSSHLTLQLTIHHTMGAATRGAERGMEDHPLSLLHHQPRSATYTGPPDSLHRLDLILQFRRLLYHPRHHHLLPQEVPLPPNCSLGSQPHQAQIHLKSQVPFLLSIHTHTLSSFSERHSNNLCKHVLYADSKITN